MTGSVRRVGVWRVLLWVVVAGVVLSGGCYAFDWYAKIRTEARFQSDFALVLDALRGYMADSDGYLWEYNDVPIEDLETDGTYGVGDSQPTVTRLHSDEFERICRHLQATGYLQAIPEVDLTGGTGYFAPTSFNSIYLTFRIGARGLRLPVHNIAFAAPWPTTRVDLIPHYWDLPYGSVERPDLHAWVHHRFPTQDPNDTASLLWPVCYYNASNGLDSFGFVYRDLLGNCSSRE